MSTEAKEPNVLRAFAMQRFAVCVSPRPRCPQQYHPKPQKRCQRLALEPRHALPAPLRHQGVRQKLGGVQGVHVRISLFEQIRIVVGVQGIHLFSDPRLYLLR